MERLESFHLENVESRVTSDERLCDGRTADDGRTQKRDSAHNPTGLRAIAGIQGDGGLRPLEAADGLGCREGRVNLAREVLEVVEGWRGLGLS